MDDCCRNPTRIECEIIKAVQRALHGKLLGRRERTVRIKSELYDLGYRHNYNVWGVPSQQEPGWLWDLMWLKREGTLQEANLRIKEIYLVCEIEWNTNEGELLWDFLKLTVCDAPVRLFIFSETNPERIDRKFKMLVKASPASRDFKYLAICVCGDGRLETRAWA